MLLNKINIRLEIKEILLQIRIMIGNYREGEEVCRKSKFIPINICWYSKRT